MTNQLITTKKVKLKLCTANAKWFARALLKRGAEGWQLPEVFGMNTNPYIITLEKVVAIDSPIKDFEADRCRPVDLIPVVALEETATILPYQSKTEVKKDLAEMIENFAKGLGDTATLMDNEKVLDCALEEELDRNTKSLNGFVKKAYTLEEVKKLRWGSLQKIASDLGIIGGRKSEIEENVVIQSKTQWGGV
jgi:hypothetical protein